MTNFRNFLERIVLKILKIYPYKITISSSLKYLKEQGLKVGENFNMMQGCIIDDSFCWLIQIGDNVTLAPNVHVLAHDASTKNVLGYTMIRPVTIGSNVFIGAGTIVLPGVTIGDNVVIGAGSIITRDVSENSVVYGNGQISKTYDQFKNEKLKALYEAQTDGRLYDETYTVRQVSEEKKRQMQEKKGGFII